MVSNSSEAEVDQLFSRILIVESIFYKFAIAFQMMHSTFYGS